MNCKVFLHQNGMTVLMRNNLIVGNPFGHNWADHHLSLFLASSVFFFYPHASTLCMVLSLCIIILVSLKS